MNHDDSHSNPDLQPFIEPGLEARVVAWVVGEASAFEAAELERICAEKPELAIFKRRIEAVHGLTGKAARPEMQPLRLSPERREKLLKTIGTEPGRSENREVFVPSPKRRTARDFLWVLRTYGLAACVAVAVVGTIATFLIPTVGTVRESARRTVAESEARQEAQHDLIADSEGRKSERLQRAVSDEEAGKTPYRGLAAPSLSARTPTPSSPAPSMARGSYDLPALAPRSEPADAVAASRSGESDADWFHETIVESQFEVTAEPDVGYTASNTLAGSRMNTSLRDVGSSVSVVTKQFMDDTAATDNQSLLRYTANTEVGGVAGNFSGADKETSPASSPSFNDFTAPSVNKPSVGESVGSHSDPNGVLFGQGAPAGIISTEADKDTRQYGVAQFEPGFLKKSEAREEEIVLSPFVVENEGAVQATPQSTPPGRQTSASNRDANQKRVDSLVAAEKRPRAEAEREAREAEAAMITVELAMLRKAKSDTVTNRVDAAGKEVQRLESRLAELKGRLSGEKNKAASAAAPDETSTAVEPTSTFSLHVSDVSFRLAQAALARGEAPDPARIRPEEFYNAFDYGDPAPLPAEKIACRIEQAAHPVLQQRNLVRIAVRVPATGRGAGQPLRLTVLLDTSGSMEREDRAASVQHALDVLASLLGPNDRVTLIGFARQPRLLVEALPGDQAARLRTLAAQTPSEGGTNLEAALQLALTKAQQYFDAAAQNRVVLITDGAANLGNADPERLAATIETARQQGLAFDACGVGTDGLDDAILETLTRKGDGRYYVLDSAADADAGFARQLAGAFRPAAQNVKLQVRFNPGRVAHYRLIGFEQHRLRNEDFRNDQVDAAELAAEEAAVAVYQVEVLPDGEGELGDVFVRFRDTAANAMVERSWTMPFDPQARAFDRATPTMQLAGVAALLAEKLRGGAMADLVRLDELAPVVNTLRGRFAQNARVQELVAMCEQARRLAGE